ncbi:glycosyltransferase involved in cell wall biosynthesis [Conyzicola nivalis]|uniref:Glycosyltransferase involved in cell wall biosynthesis n=1 Tax=Conyzicola nivalis TaxID=1477021 RepID=A0ABV2QR49_9MICO
MARILVNLLSYTGKKGGMETYARELYRELGTRDDGHQYLGYASSEFMKLDHSWFPGRVVDSGFSGENRWVWAFAELFMVARAARRMSADLIHSPANLGPWRSKVPSVYTIHDLLYYHLPGHMAVPLYTKPVQWMEQRAADNATVIITDSEASSVDIQKYLDFPEDRVRVVQLAGTPPKVAVDQGATRERDLLLAVGNRIPHKNFESLVRAIALIPVEQRPRLVVTGSRGDDPLRPVVDELGLAEWVDLKTWVSDDELAWLYAHATALMEPAYWNGFNLPALEAMLVGLPVLMSDISVYHEVGGDAVGYFDPNDLEAIAAIMVRATSDADWLRQLAERGREHHKGFTWDRTASETVAAFDEALAYGSRAKSRRR